MAVISKITVRLAQSLLWVQIPPDPLQLQGFMFYSRLCTQVVDGKHIKPSSNQRVLVWDADAKMWRVAKFIFGQFELYGYGRKGYIRGRWWMPIPQLPEGDT